MNTKATKTIIPAEQARAAFKAVVDESDNPNIAGLMLADALRKNEFSVTSIAYSRIAVNVMPGLGDAVVEVTINEFGRLTYEVIAIHPAMERDTAELWTGAASLSEVEQILVTIGHG